VVELVVGKEEHEKLKELGITTARCWNELTAPRHEWRGFCTLWGFLSSF